MARQRKPKSRIPKLSDRELRLAQHPPGEKTWECQAVNEKPHYEGQKVETWTCGMANSDKYKVCVACKSPRPKKPVLLYPQYSATMKKLGLEPGTSFKVVDNGTAKGTWRFKREKVWEDWTEEVFDEGSLDGNQR